MEADEKIRIKAYVRAKQSLSLHSAQSWQRMVEVAVAELDAQIAEAQLTLENLRSDKRTAAATLAGIKKAIKERQ